VLSSDRNVATHGQIAGIIDKDEIQIEMHRLRTKINPALCDIIGGPPFDFGQTADILVDGTQDPGQTCDGISAGFGFTMKRAQLGQEVEVEAIPPGPCPPEAP